MTAPPPEPGNPVGRRLALSKPHQMGLLMIAARALGVLLAIATALVVTPEVFGIYGMMQAVALIAGTFQFLRVERAILIADSAKQAMYLTHACLDLSVLTTVIGTIACALIVPGLTEHPGWQMLLVLFALSIFAKGLIMLAFAWMQRFGLAVEQPIMMMLQATAQFVAQIALIQVMDQPLLALVAGEAIGATIAVITVLLMRRHWPVLLISRRPYSLASVLKLWSHFPLINMPAAVLSQVLVSLPLLTLGHIISPERLGNFAFALRLADAPFQLLSAAAASVVLTEGWHRIPRSTGREHRLLRRYLAVVLATAVLVGLSAWLLDMVLPPGRLSATVVLIPVAVVLAMAIALGAPMQDVAAFRHGEALMLLVHAGMALAGIMIWALAPTMRSVVFGFAAIFALRSLAAIVIAETGSGAALKRPPQVPGQPGRPDLR